MNTSESITNIAPALLVAQKAITFAAKDAVNPHFKSKYADLPTVIDALKPALNAAGIVFLQMPAPSDPGSLALCTRLLHTSGEWIESTATAPLQKNDPQGYGSALTYLRRYSLAAAVGLYQDDDDGHAASQTVKPPALVKRGVAADVLAYSPLNAEDEAYLRELAVEVKELFDRDGALAAVLRLSVEDLENEQRIYIAQQWDSKTRNAIKAASVQHHSKATA